MSPRAEPGKKIAVTGRVLDPAGKPVVRAKVAVVLWEVLTFSSWERPAIDGTRLVARTTSDADGRFRLTVPQPLPVFRHQLLVLARAPGHGIGWAAVKSQATRAEAEVRLLPEGAIAGRVVDLQGGPVAGLTISATHLTWHKGDDWRHLPLPRNFVTATTDNQGRFAFRGVGRDLGVHLEINDLHCAPKELDVNTGEPEKSGRLVIGVAPPAILEGRVVCEDTDEPMANAALLVQTSAKSKEGLLTPRGVVTGRTDARGHFKVSTLPGSTGFVLVQPPQGQPYLATSKTFDWPRGAVRQEVEVKLARGVLLHGKVTEAPGGKPVANASVQNGGNWVGRVLTAADGSYSLAVPPGRARLLVAAPTPDYIAAPVGSAELLIGKPGGDPVYYHAAATLDLKKDEKSKEVSFALRRGVTLKGTVVNPDGKPVNDAVLLVGGLRPLWEKTLTPIEVHNGRWELRGCDPGRRYHLLFLACPEMPPPGRTFEGPGSPGRPLLPMLLGPKNKLGAAVEASAKNAGAEPLEVRLKPTGSARLHLLDANGKPAPHVQPSLELVVSPGPPFPAALQAGAMAGETVYLTERLAPAGKPSGKGDPPGTLTIHGLIPGATYRLRQLQQPKVFKDFKAKSGKTVEVDVPVVP